MTVIALLMHMAITSDYFTEGKSLQTCMTTADAGPCSPALTTCYDAQGKVSYTRSSYWDQEKKSCHVIVQEVQQ